MKNSWESKKILAYGKKFSVFTSIMLVLLFAFSCSNLIMNDGGSLIIAVPGARAASASSYTIELTGSNGTTQRKTVAGGTTAQFDDLDPDTYTISVKGTNESVVVLYGTSSATVSAGATASAMVKMGTVANDLNSLQQAVTAGGIVYIGSDINVDSTLTVNTDVTLLPLDKAITLKKSGDIELISVTAGKLTVGGNDYTITLDGDSSNITSTKNLIKVNGAGSTIYLNRNSVVMNNAGTGVSITGQNYSNKAYLYLNSGTISNNKSGGVSLSYAEFVMNGGSINGNSFNSQISGGAGVSVGGAIFTMKGGTISDNEMTSNDGGAIKVTPGGSFTMDGGSIEGNSATGSGGGVYVASGSFIMNGGSIKGNSAATGKGVYATTDNFKMSGNAVIDLGNDVCLGDGNRITVTGALSTTSTVALITPTNYSSPHAVLAVENGVKLADVIKKFNLTQPEDGSAEYIINDEGKLQKVEAQ